MLWEVGMRLQSAVDWLVLRLRGILIGELLFSKFSTGAVHSRVLSQGVVRYSWCGSTEEDSDKNVFWENAKIVIYT